MTEDDPVTIVSPEARRRKPFRRPASAFDQTDRQRAIADAGAEEALVTGSIIRPVPQRYHRSFGAEPGAEPSQDNEDMRLVLETLKLIGRTVEQVDITRSRQVILINDDGNRAVYQLDIGDETPELLRPRLEAVLATIPQRYNDSETAASLQDDLHAEVLRFGPRIERGGLE